MILQTQQPAPSQLPALDQQSIGFDEIQQTQVEQQTESKDPEVEQLERDLVEHILDMYSRYKNSEYRAKKLEEIKQARMDYEQEQDKKAKGWPWKNASALNLPLAMIAIDNAEPRIVAALEGKGDEICRFKDVGEQDDLMVLSTWFNNELIHGVQLRKPIRSTAQRLLIEGTCYVMPEYESQKELRRDFVWKPVPVLDPATGMPISAVTGQPIISMDEPLAMSDQEEIAVDEQGNMLMQDIEDTVHEGVSVELLDFETVYLPDSCEDWDNTDFVREVDIPYTKLAEAQQDGVIGYQNIDEKLWPEGTLTPEDNKVVNERIIPCLEAHISWDFQRNYEREHGKHPGKEKIVALIATTSRTLIRLCLQRDILFSNRKIIRRMRLFPTYGKAYGTGMAAKLKEIQKGGSSTFNLILNSSYVTMIPWYFYGMASGLDKPIELMPGVGVPVADASQVKFPSFNVNPMQYVPFINMFISMWERISSISDVQVGRAPEIQGNRAQTATTTMMQVQEANIKHNYLSKTLQEEFSDLLEIIYDLYYMKCPIETIWEQEGKIRFPGKSLMRQKRKFVLTGTTDSANRFVDRSEAETLYGQLSQDPIVSRPALVMDMLRTYGKHDPDSYIDPNINQILAIYQQNPQAVMQAMQQLVMMMTLAQQQEQNATANPKGANGGSQAQAPAV